MLPNHQRIPSDEDDLTVPSLALCASTIYSSTPESWRLKSPSLPQRHRWRFEMMMKKDEKLRGSYFSPTSPVNNSGITLEKATDSAVADKEVHIPRLGSANTPRALNEQTNISLPGPTQPELNHIISRISTSKQKPHLSDLAVSLSSPISPLKTCLPGASLPNQTGLISSFTEAHQTTSPLVDLPALPLPPLFTSLAITDPNVGGQPIRYISTSFRSGSNNLKVGCCTFLNLVYRANVECGLCIEPRQRTDNLSPTSDTEQERTGGKASVLLQIVQTVVNARTGRVRSKQDSDSQFRISVRSYTRDYRTSPQGRNFRGRNGWKSSKKQWRCNSGISCLGLLVLPSLLPRRRGRRGKWRKIRRGWEEERYRGRARLRD